IQYCPVNLRGIGQEANGGGAFRVTKGVSDLNRKWRFALAFRVSPPRSRHVPRQDPVCADHGLPAVEDLPSHRRSIQRRLPDAQPQLRRAVSRHGLCATDLPRKLARYRSVCGKLYHMGIGAAVARSTLADANESRDWRIYFELAQRLIIKARALYVDEDFGV